MGYCTIHHRTYGYCCGATVLPHKGRPTALHTLITAAVLLPFPPFDRVVPRAQRPV